MFPRVFPSSEKMKTGYRENLCNPLILLAEWTGLEPATPGVTGQHFIVLRHYALRANRNWHLHKTKRGPATPPNPSFYL